MVLNMRDLGNIRGNTKLIMDSSGASEVVFLDYENAGKRTGLSYSSFGEVSAYHLEISINASARPKVFIFNLRTSSTVRLDYPFNILDLALTYTHSITYLRHDVLLTSCLWCRTTKLCCGILATTDIKVDYKKLAEDIGLECTHRAVEFQAQKMKKADKASNLAGTLSKSTGKRKATEHASVDGGDFDENPSKPAKKSKNRARDDDGDEALESGGEASVEDERAEDMWRAGLLKAK